MVDEEFLYMVGRKRHEGTGVMLFYTLVFVSLWNNTPFKVSFSYRYIPVFIAT